MSGPLSNPYMFKSATAAGFYEYQIANSIRGSAADDRTLKWTAGTPTSADTFTMAYWVKRQTDSTTDSANNIFVTGTGGGTYFYISLGLDLFFEGAGGNWSTSYLQTSAAYRDTSAWYHHILVFDSTQSTENDRLKVYVNGERITSFAQDSMHGNIGSSEDFSFINASGIVQAFGGLSGKGHGTEGADLSLADVMFFDGQSYYSELGEYKNGVWIPKDPSGLTFGNNGYWLKFTNSSNLGEDFSGNDNDFTVANFASHDQLLDSPTFGSSSSGNFPTLNPLFKHENMTFSEGNLKHSTSTNNRGVMCNIAIPKTGKWYWEHLSVAFHNPGGDETHNVGVNIASVNIDGGDRGGRATGITYASYNGGKSVEADSTASYGSAWAEGDIVGIEFDADNGTINFSKNGSWQGDISLTTAQQAKEWFPFVGMGGATNQEIGIFNFGQDSSFAGEKTAQGNADDNGYGDFYYSPPSGALALCSGNLPVATEIDPASTDDNYPQKLFSNVLYTGNAGTNNITGVGFQPDLTWIKIRNTASNGPLVDSSRGTNKVIFSTINNAEVTSANLTSFDSDGFSLDDTSDYLANFNGSSNTYVARNWRANGGSTSSGSGDLTSTHQVDPSGGFSIVKAVGDGGSSGDKTVTHGMSAAPDCILAKNLDSGFNWDTYWSSGLTATSYGLRLNTNDNQLSGRWGTVNSSIFTCKYNYTWVGSDNFIYYCFRNIEGYIKVGAYEGNGDGSNGAFVYTGFRPAFIMVKRTDGSKSWLVQDNARDTYNPVYHLLKPNSHNAEEAYTDGTDYNDFLSNGFKVARGGDAANWNNSGSTYVYLAMAHNPFKYATAR